MKLAEYHGIELPIYDDSTPVAWYRRDLELATADPHAETFFRGTRLQCPGAPNLGAALRLTNRLLEEAGVLLDASPVTYRWGLFRGQPPRQAIVQPPHLVAEGYALIAEVDILRPVSPVDSESGLALSGQIISDRQRRKAAGEPYLFDLGSGQLVDTSIDGQPCRRIVDIEARILGSEQYAFEA